MSVSTTFLWDCLDAYETGYTTVLRQNKAVEKELADLRSDAMLLELSNKFLTKENNMQKDIINELRREIQDQHGHFDMLQSQVHECRTVETQDIIDCDNRNRINYFADAINHQRDLYNNLKQNYEQLKTDYQHKEVASFSAQEEIRLLHKEVDRLKEAAVSPSNEETFLTSSFLQIVRENNHRHLKLYDGMQMPVTSETIIEDLTAKLPHDLLRHRMLNLDGRAFEFFSCHLFECLGYKTTHRGGACDLGIDFEIREKDSSKTWAGTKESFFSIFTFI